MRIKVYDKDLIPSQGGEGDAGYDLRAADELVLGPGESGIVGTGVHFGIPKGYYGLLTHRSSLAFKHGCILSLGIIDSNFTGEVKCLVFNLGQKELYLKEGERFAQIIFNRYYTDKMEIVEELEDGKDGFGSSGKS